jgi:hypothetical protein
MERNVIKNRKIAKRLAIGSKYHMLWFDGGTYMVYYGKLVKGKSDYSFCGERGIVRLFKSDDIKRAKVGQPVRKIIRNGKMEFYAFFEAEKEATNSVDRLVKSVAVHIIKESIDADKNTINKINNSVMKRISVLGEIMLSESASDINSSIKKLKF